jgi:putative flippase GtrA
MSKSDAIIMNMVGFGLISLIGFFVDVQLFILLLRVEVSPFISSIISSTIAITIVFVLTTVFIKKKNVQKVYDKYLYWVLYQVLSILFFSKLVSLLMVFGYEAITSKLSVVPLSFISNYIVIEMILKKKS